MYFVFTVTFLPNKQQFFLGIFDFFNAVSLEICNSFTNVNGFFFFK